MNLQLAKLNCFKVALNYLVQNEQLESKIFPCQLFIDNKNKGDFYLIATNFRLFLFNSQYQIQYLESILSFIPIDKNDNRETRVKLRKPKNPQADKLCYQLMMHIDQQEKMKYHVFLDKNYQHQFNTLMQQQCKEIPHQENIIRELFKSYQNIVKDYKEFVISKKLLNDQQFWAHYEKRVHLQRQLLSIEQMHLAKNIEILSEAAIEITNVKEEEENLRDIFIFNKSFGEHQCDYCCELSANLELSSGYLRNRPPKKKERRIQIQQFENIREQAKIQRDLQHLFIKNLSACFINDKFTIKQTYPKAILPSDFYIALQQENDGFSINQQENGVDYHNRRKPRTNLKSQNKKPQSQQWLQDKKQILSYVNLGESQEPIIRCDLKLIPEQHQIILNEKELESLKTLQDQMKFVQLKLKVLYETIDLKQNCESIKENIKQEINFVRSQINQMKLNGFPYQKSVKEDLQRMMERALNQT